VIQFTNSELQAHTFSRAQQLRKFIYTSFNDNLDSILKSRDITLPTKVHLFKAMVFPVVMYGYENLTIKKAEPVLLHCGVGEDT